MSQKFQVVSSILRAEYFLIIKLKGDERNFMTKTALRYKELLTPLSNKKNRSAYLVVKKKNSRMKISKLSNISTSTQFEPIRTGVATFLYEL